MSKGEKNSCYITDEFKQTLNSIKRAIELELRELIIKMEDKAMWYLREYSPVDTGFLRNNWSIKIGTPVTDIKELQKGVKFKSDSKMTAGAKAELAKSRNIVSLPYTITNISRGLKYQWNGWTAAGYQILDVRMKPNGKLEVLRASSPLVRFDGSYSRSSRRRKSVIKRRPKRKVGSVFTIMTKRKKMPASDKLRGTKSGGHSVIKRIHAAWKTIVNKSQYWRMPTTRNLKPTIEFGVTREPKSMHRQ